MKRILVVKLSSLGDIAHALPAVAALKARTGAELDWVAQPEYVPLLECCRDLHRVIPFPRRDTASRFIAFCRDLRRDSYDLVVDLQGLMKSAMVSRLARAAWRVGPAWAREGAPWLYDARAERRPGPRAHATDELLDVVDSIAPPEDGATPPPPLDFAFPERTEDLSPGPHIAFTPFSRWTTKDWPLEKFVELGRRLASEIGARIRVLGSAADVPAATELCAGLNGAGRNLCGQLDLPGMCGLLRQMDLLVGVDSGPLHWADALGVPLVAVYGATDPVRTGPWHQRDGVVTAASALSCRPCHARICARGDIACLRDLDVESVLRAALARL